MSKEFKALLFAISCLLFGGVFVVQWIATRNIVEAFVLMGQIAALMVAIVLGFVFFMWLGMKIFK